MKSFDLLKREMNLELVRVGKMDNLGSSYRANDRRLRMQSNYLRMKRPGPATVSFATLYAFGNGLWDVVTAAMVSPFI